MIGCEAVPYVSHSKCHTFTESMIACECFFLCFMNNK